MSDCRKIFSDRDHYLVAPRSRDIFPLEPRHVELKNTLLIATPIREDSASFERNQNLVPAGRLQR